MRKEEKKGGDQTRQQRDEKLMDSCVSFLEAHVSLPVKLD